MFDMGFLELLLIGIIALIVLGPERLPKAARTLGLWVGKARQSFNSIKTEIDRELKIQEIQQQLKEQKDKLENQLGSNAIHESLSDTQRQIQQLAEEISHPLDGVANDKPSDTEAKPVTQSPTKPHDQSISE